MSLTQTVIYENIKTHLKELIIDTLSKFLEYLIFNFLRIPNNNEKL